MVDEGQAAADAAWACLLACLLAPPSTTRSRRPEEFAALADYAVDDFMSEAASEVEVFSTKVDRATATVLTLNMSAYVAACGFLEMPVGGGRQIARGSCVASRVLWQWHAPAAVPAPANPAVNLVVAHGSGHERATHSVLPSGHGTQP